MFECRDSLNCRTVQWDHTYEVVWLIPRFTGVGRNRDKEKFSNIFKARQISKQDLGPSVSQPIFFYSASFPLLLIFFPSMIDPKLEGEFTFIWLRLSFRNVSINY